MNRYIKIAALMSVMFISISVNAAMHDKYGAKITEVYINSSGSMIIQIEGVSGYLALGSVGNKVAELMYSTALAAKLSGQSNLWIRYRDATKGYPIVGIISIQ